MSHRTYRHLDTPVPYLGLSWRQWLLIIACAAFALAVIDLLHPPTPVALWLGTVMIAGPAILSYFTSTASLSLGGLLLDHTRWLLAPRKLPAAHTVRQPRARGFLLADTPRGRPWTRRPRRSQGEASSGDLLPLQALAADGVGVLASGALVRWVELERPINPLIHDGDEAESISRALAGVMARLGERQSLQLLAHATPLPTRAIIARERETHACAAGRARTRGQQGLAVALERLALAQEQSIALQSHALAALALRYLVVVPWLPAGSLTPRVGGGGPVRMTPAAYERAVRDHARHCDGVRSDLQAAGFPARELDGREVAGLLWEHLAPTNAEGEYPPLPALQLPGTLAELNSPRPATRHALELRRVLCRWPVDLRQRGAIHVGGEARQTRFLASLPEQTSLAVHVPGTDRARERLHHRRRYKRIFGNNRGTELKGRPLDPDQSTQEQEAAELNSELALSAAGVYRIACYLTVREGAGDTGALTEILDGITRELSAASDAQLHPALAAQQPTYASTLPCGLDAARRTRKYVSLNVGDTTPLLGARCGSPAGIPIGYAAVGRTLERLDLFDSAHSNHILVLVGSSGAGKTTLLNKFYAASLAQGARGAIIERGGHYDFLVSLIPGAATVRLGYGCDAICPWDTPDPGSVGPEKIDYLIALHATLIGTGRPHEYGLSALEQNLLGRAISQVYERCALTGETPRELLLAETLLASAQAEAAAHIRDVLEDLAARLHNFTGSGPYAYLTDRPTTIPVDAPLVVFDTRSIPEHFAGAAMIEIVEHISSRAQASHEHHIQDGTGHGGDAYIVALEECWKLMDREATGRWITELPRRSRHLRLGVIGVSQQFSDFDNAWGRALIENASQTITFKQSLRQIELMRTELGLSREETHTISQHVRTVKREYATAYWVNGPRGRGAITVRLSPLEYWTATHDPEHDEPLRQHALREAGGDPWRALRLLADPAWHQQLTERSTA